MYRLTMLGLAVITLLGELTLLMEMPYLTVDILPLLMELTHLLVIQALI